MAAPLPGGLLPSAGLCPRAPQAPTLPPRHANLASAPIHPSAIFAPGAGLQARARGNVSESSSSSASARHAAFDHASAAGLSSRASFSQAPAVRLLSDRPLGPKPRLAVRADLVPQATATGSWGRTNTEGVGGTDHAFAGPGKAASSSSPSPPHPAPTPRSAQQGMSHATAERERERESLSTRAIRLSQSLRSERLRAVDLHKIEGAEQASAAAEPPPLEALDALPLLTRRGVRLRRQDPEPQGPEHRLERDNEALSARVILGSVPENSLSYLDLDFSPSPSPSSSSPSSASSSTGGTSLATGAATAAAATAASAEPSSSRLGTGYSNGGPLYRMGQESNPSLRLLAAAQGPNAVQWLQASNGASSGGLSPTPVSPTAAGAYSAPTPFARSRTPAPSPPSAVSAATAMRGASPGLAVVPGGDVEASAVNGATTLSSVVGVQSTGVSSGVLVEEDVQGFAEAEAPGDGVHGDAPATTAATVSDHSVSGVQSPGLRKTVTKGAVTWVRLVRNLPGQEDAEATATADNEEGDGQEKEGEGGEGVLSGGDATPGAGASAEHRAAGQLGEGEGPQEGFSSGSTQGVKSPPASNSRASAQARAEMLRSELAALEAGGVGEGAPGAEVSSGDLDTVLGRLEVKYQLTDEALVGGNVRTLMMQLGARGGQVMRVVAKQPGLLSRSIGEEAGALVGVLDSYEIRRTALLQGLGRSLDCLAVGAEQADGVLAFLDRQVGVNNLGRVVSTMPHVLGQSVEEIASTVALLRDLDVPDIGAALERNPALLGRGAADVREKVEALEALVKGRGAVRGMVHRCAPLMLASPEATRDAFSRLVKLLGEDEAIRIVTAQPQVLATDAGMVERAATQLISHFGPGATASMLAENGSLVRRKWDATAAKLQFLEREMGRSAEEVAAWPKVLTYNLEARLRRRWGALKAHLGGEGSEVAAALGALSLRSVFGCSDAVFERRFSVQLPVAALRKRGRKPAVKLEEIPA